MSRTPLLVGTVAVVGMATFSPPAFADHDDQACRPAQSGVERRTARAAVDALGGGTALCVERERGGTVRWEVDVRRDGRRYEVELDRALRVIDQERDDDADDRDDADD